MIPIRWNWITVVVIPGGCENPVPCTVSPSDVVAFAESHFGLEPGLISKEIRGPSTVSDVRHMLRHYFRLHFKGMTLEEVGEVTGSSSHATIWSSVRKHSDFMGHDKKYRSAYIRFEYAAWAAGFHYKREQP